MKRRLAPTIAAVSETKLIAPPPPGSIWARIERAREELGLTRTSFGEEALDGRQNYNTIRARGWGGLFETVERLVSFLVSKGYSPTWLWLGTPPELGKGESLPLEKSVMEKLRLLARRLALPDDEVIALWGDLNGAGPLEKYSEDIQRAGFAAAYLDGRTLDDVRRAIQIAQKETMRGAGKETWLQAIRDALKTIKHASGERPALTLVPPSK